MMTEFTDRGEPSAPCSCSCSARSTSASPSPAAPRMPAFMKLRRSGRSRERRKSGQVGAGMVSGKVGGWEFRWERTRVSLQDTPRNDYPPARYGTLWGSGTVGGLWWSLRNRRDFQALFKGRQLAVF